MPLRREKCYVSKASLIEEMVKSMLQTQTFEIFLVDVRHCRVWAKAQLSEVRPSMFRQCYFLVQQMCLHFCF